MFFPPSVCCDDPDQRDSDESNEAEITKEDKKRVDARKIWKEDGHEGGGEMTGLGVCDGGCPRPKGV